MLCIVFVGMGHARLWFVFFLFWYTNLVYGPNGTLISLFIVWWFSRLGFTSSSVVFLFAKFLRSKYIYIYVYVVCSIFVWVCRGV